MTWAWNSSSNPLAPGPRPQTPQSTWGLGGGWDFPSAPVLGVGEGQATPPTRPPPRRPAASSTDLFLAPCSALLRAGDLFPVWPRPLLTGEQLVATGTCWSLPGVGVGQALMPEGRVSDLFVPVGGTLGRGGAFARL